MPTLYVDGDNGDDGNDGSTELLAKATITAAITAASSGDTIYIQNNGSTVYSERLSITDKSLQLVGYGSVTTDNTKAELDGTSAGAGIGITVTMTTDAPWCQMFQNLYIHDYSSHGVYMVRSGGAGNPCAVLHNCKINDNGDRGFYINNYWTAKLIQCTVQGNTGDGIQMTTGGTVILSRVLANGGFGVYGQTTSPTTVIESEVAANAGNFRNCDVVHRCISDATVGQDGMIVPSEATYTRASMAIIVGAGISNTPATYYGINNGGRIVLISCGFYNNTTGNYTGTPTINNDPVTGSNPQYHAAGTYDFSLDGAAWKAQAILIGCLDDAQTSSRDIGARQVTSSAGDITVITMAPVVAATPGHAAPYM